MVLDDIEFETEFSFHELGSKRIDIIGVLEEVSLTSREGETTSIRIIIENKIKARESKDQTSTYYEFAKLSSEDFQYDVFIFLTPDESQIPSCDQFIQITYQTGILSLSDTLYATYLGTDYFATLKKDNEGVVIVHGGTESRNPSRFATAIRNQATNGLVFWKVKDQRGVDKGSLGELRLRLDLEETPEVGD